MMYSLFSIQKRPPTREEVKRSRQIAAESLAGLKIESRRSYTLFLSRGALVVPAALCASWLSGSVGNFALEVGVRIAMVCAISAWLLHWMYQAYQTHTRHIQELEVMQGFLKQLQSVPKHVQQDFTEQNVFVFEVVNYIQHVEAEQRAITVGELEMLQAYADEFNAVNSQALSYA